MKPMLIVTLSMTLVLAACAIRPAQPGPTAKCDNSGFVPRTYKLQVRTDRRGAPSRVDRNLTWIEQRALAVRAGDTVEWQLWDDFAIDFPVAGPEGGPKKYTGRRQIRVTMPCRDYCADAGAIVRDGVCYSLYKYNVWNVAGTLDPMIVVER